MNLQEYQILASRTCPSLGTSDKDYAHMISGIVTEYGELLDGYKKNLAYGKPLDKVNIAEEWADGMWYFVNLARMFPDRCNIHLIEAGAGWTTEVSSYGGIITDLIGFTCALGMGIAEDDLRVALAWWWHTGNVLELDRFKALENNINKLKLRFPDKFDADRAINRDHAAERVELEK